MIKIFIFVFSFNAGIQLSRSRNLSEPPLPEICAPITNTEKLQKLQITGLNGTIDENTLSGLQNVIEIRISSSQIRNITPGSLCPSSSLKILELDLDGNTKPPTISKSMFEGCELDELLLKFDYNDPSTIDEDALENLKSLKRLRVHSLRYSWLKKNFLHVSENLTSLILHHLNLRKIEYDFFENMSNLEEVEIVFNWQLQEIPADLFQNCPKLKRLILKDNGLQDLSWDEFKCLSLLEELDVSQNELYYFDAEKIAKNMPNLRKLAIQGNGAGRQDEENFVAEIKRRFGRSLKISNNKNLNIKYLRWK